MDSSDFPCFVRVGVLGRIGRFLPAEPMRMERGDRVVCRTVRGLEIGEVVSQGWRAWTPDQIDGQMLRRVTAADQLIIARLGKNRDQAFQRCTQLLRQAGCPAILMDVEQLFDGSVLYFYFLGDPPSELEPLIQSLAETYDSQVRFSEFALAAELGCGPDCGTERAEGCGTGCETCAVLSACRHAAGH